ncbi:hypothetical protein DAI22_11g074400 [Oryza sativa Japonica Group]|nr:hypothetical protein DAI22_11g074400 [Oryza sativa Japonica Group]
MPNGHTPPPTIASPSLFLSLKRCTSPDAGHPLPLHRHHTTPFSATTSPFAIVNPMHPHSSHNILHRLHLATPPPPRPHRCCSRLSIHAYRRPESNYLLRPPPSPGTPPIPHPCRLPSAPTPLRRPGTVSLLICLPPVTPSCSRPPAHTSGPPYFFR